MDAIEQKIPELIVRRIKNQFRKSVLIFPEI
jgi:hypothetical protein